MWKRKVWDRKVWGSCVNRKKYEKLNFSACDCDESGSASISCSSNGDCSCRNGYSGQKCDCFPGYYMSGTNCVGKIL